MKPSRPYAAFTLIEMLTVVAVIAVIAAVAAPTLTNFRKGDSMLASTRQLLGAVARGRQLAISQHTTVYMVFIPTNYWGNPLPVQMRTTTATNMADKQLTGYFYVCLRSVGDQPGQIDTRYLTPVQTLPAGTFIPPWKFNSRQPVFITNYLDSAGLRKQVYKVFNFNNNSLPFPTENSTLLASLPCIAFNYLGQLTLGDGSMENQDEYIPLAQGSVLSPGVDANGNFQLAPPSVFETPLGNSTNNFNLVHIDRFTGRARLEHQEIR